MAFQLINNQFFALSLYKTHIKEHKRDNTEIKFLYMQLKVATSSYIWMICL